MGRTIHYSIFGDFEPIAPRVQREIMLCQNMLNQRFTWTCENLSFELFEHVQITYDEPRKPWAPRLGWGFTKVGDDEWNAFLVAKFVRWVSSRLPTATVTLYDEGDFVFAGRLLLHEGQPSLDQFGIERQRAFLRSQGLAEELKELDRAESMGRQGVFFADRPVYAYADRPEIRALNIPEAELKRMSFDDIAERFEFLRQTKRLRAA